MGVMSGVLCSSGFRHVLVLSAVVLFCVSATMLAQAPGDIDVHIEPVFNALPGDTVDVSINISNAYSEELGGAAFAVQFDTLALKFIEGIPKAGPCPWFGATTYEISPGLLSFIGAMATFHCTIDDLGNPVLVLRFVVKNDPLLVGYITPVQFVWIDCTHNALSNDLGSQEMRSHNVYRWFDDSTSVAHNSDIPTIFGSPDSCLTGSVLSNINFYSGFVGIADSVLNDIGDLNLNGISCEIADAVVLGDYLRHGISAFTVNLGAQLNASDVDADIRRGTLSDYIYLLQVINSNAARTQGWRGYVSSHTAFVVQHLDTKVVNIDYPDSVAALLLRFSGNVQVVSSNLPYQLETISETGNTRILYIPAIDDQPLPQFPGSIDISYSGVGRLTEVQLADVNDARIPVVINRVPGNENVCGDASADGLVSFSDAVFIINYIFGAGSAPPDLVAADADCNGNVSIADALFIINYVLGIGPGPCSTCN